MLSSLQIENVAVIQKANVHFEKGLNVLTGETGAGQIYPDRLHQCHSGQPHLQGSGAHGGCKSSHPGGI